MDWGVHGLHIDVEVFADGVGNHWRLTSFYGLSYAQNKTDSWRLLRDLGCVQDLPWLVCGDFNEILYAFMKLGGFREMKREWRLLEMLWRNVNY
ncbi:reverse transcriptase [Gossypium australe]|uniref:Reverse transcriptase n=1 Tax=Gossypium australe TaxID=47621 RepID=A0A5B6W786_9ROSI|nr:reverse transcriptase [Gossypium australe]